MNNEVEEINFLMAIATVGAMIFVATLSIFVSNIILGSMISRYRKRRYEKKIFDLKNKGYKILSIKTFDKAGIPVLLEVKNSNNQIEEYYV